MFDLHGSGFGRKHGVGRRTDRLPIRRRAGGAAEGLSKGIERRARRGALARGLAALAVAGLVALAPAPASAESTGREVGLGVASLMSTLLYGPAKLTFALGGSLVSGLAWCITGGDMDVARPIFHSAVRGDYLITSDHLTGRRSVEFVGRRPEDEWGDGSGGEWEDDSDSSESDAPGWDE